MFERPVRDLPSGIHQSPRRQTWSGIENYTIYERQDKPFRNPTTLPASSSHFSTPGVFRLASTLQAEVPVDSIAESSQM